ncbi:hypothetical protein Tsubulata_024555 [Turnera subulata]|uniref:Uncharacterized protein n=1 Tax=Turnera subulata TaxID=218843 RepID=A0A9Q0G520_9ROSI|nr:hypothetical protein Tsubulata_024555 [Turnera subulata]
MSGREDSDSDAPEEFTAEQGIQQYEDITRIQRENKARVARKAKEDRRKWAERKTPRSSKGHKAVQDVIDTEPEKEPTGAGGLLPADIVELLAAREKKMFLSDSEDEKVEAKRPSRKKKRKTSGKETVILKELPPPQCLQSSLEFLKTKKMQVSRSSSVLNNSSQALRLISSSGLLK